jgi:hypothetical protein
MAVVIYIDKFLSVIAKFVLAFAKVLYGTKKQTSIAVFRLSVSYVIRELLMYHRITFVGAECVWRGM